MRRSLSTLLTLLAASLIAGGLAGCLEGGSDPADAGLVPCGESACGPDELCVERVTQCPYCDYGMDTFSCPAEAPPCGADDFTGCQTQPLEMEEVCLPIPTECTGELDCGCLNDLCSTSTAGGICSTVGEGRVGCLACY